ncbi:MAG TPA: hypothetical protein VIJ20_08020 [Solirubrobacteraceae bacterium]
MKRLIVGIVGIALIGVVIAGCSSSAASPRRTRTPVPAAPVSATPRLKRRLGAEISTLRAGQPTVPRPAVTPHARALSVVPESGAPCFAAGHSRCSEDACPEFVRAGPPAPVVVTPRMAAPANCPRKPRRLIAVVAP